MSRRRVVALAARWLIPLAFATACGRDERAPDGATRDARSASEIASARTSQATGAAAKDSARPATSSACVAPDASPWKPVPVGAAIFEVNRGTRGMSATIRWMLSPDSAAMLVVDDPVGIENEPIADGILFVTERTGRAWRMDSVWSVAPSPDWRRLAVGRAAVLLGGKQQRISPDAWEAPARRLREIAGDAPALRGDSLRAHSYPVSGMGVAEGAAATLLVDLEEQPPTTRFVALDGWRVGWSCDARAVLIGERPTRVQNDGPAATTRRVPIPAGAPLSSAPAMEVRWTEGPTTSIGENTEARSTGPLVVRGRTIHSRNGRVVLTESGRSGAATERDIGPGVPLAATRGGHFILALARRLYGGEHDSSSHAIVYRVP